MLPHLLQIVAQITQSMAIQIVQSIAEKAKRIGRACGGRIHPYLRKMSMRSVGGAQARYIRVLMLGRFMLENRAEFRGTPDEIDMIRVGIIFHKFGSCKELDHQSIGLTFWDHTTLLPEY